MLVEYYNNKSDERYVEKDMDKLNSANINIELIDDTNLAYPTFKLRDKDMYMTANYIKLPNLQNKGFFIRKKTVSNGFAYIECENDVLSNYERELREADVILRRSESMYELYQTDPDFKLMNYEVIKTIPFPEDAGFDPNTQAFLLCVVGNTTEE